MARYELTKDLETGNMTIDREHRELIAAVNKLLDACSAGQGRDHMKDTVKFLNDYVNRHFAHEEQLQQQSKYPGYAAHKAFHDKYKRTLIEITEAIPAAGISIGELTKLNGHISLLISHIRSEDKSSGRFSGNKETRFR